jgi:Ca2+-binding RTX toxin-like protein
MPKKFRVETLAASTPPTGANKTLSLTEDQAYTFAEADFGFADEDGDTLASIKINTVPTVGSLTLNGVKVKNFATIAAADIANLVWTPPADDNGTGLATLTFRVTDTGGQNSTSIYTLTFDVAAVADAPVAVDDVASMSEDTVAGFLVTGNDTDADGDALSVTKATVTSGDADVTIKKNGLINVDYTGADLQKGETAKIVISYTVSDGALTDTAKLTVTVNGAYAAGDDIIGTNKSETLNGSTLGETIKGLGGTDTITGFSGDDVIWGGLGNDNLLGSTGNDTLHGEDDNDVIAGNGGIDKLYGESGKDTFVFAKNDTGKTAATADTIFDFSKDNINLKLIDANTALKGDQAFTLVNGAFTGHAGELRYEKLASDTYIYGDVDGDKKADLVIHLDDAVTLKVFDFTL